MIEPAVFYGVEKQEIVQSNNQKATPDNSLLLFLEI